MRANQAVQAQQVRNNGVIGLREANNGFGNAVGYGVGGCPPGLMSKGCMPPGLALNANRIANEDAFRASQLAALTLGATPRASSAPHCLLLAARFR